MSNNSNFIIQKSQVVELFKAVQDLTRLARIVSGENRKTVNVLDDFAGVIGDVLMNVINGGRGEDEFNDLFIQLMFSDTDAMEAVERLKKFVCEMQNRSQYGLPASEAIV